MGIFTNTGSPLDQHIERATSDKNTSDDWAVILDVCDRVKEYGDGPKDCIKALGKKLTDTNPRVALQAVTLLDACVSNCGRTFLMEVASREFEQELRKLVTSPRTHSKVTEQLRKCLKSWSEGEFKSDRQLSLIPALYAKLQQEGHDFSGTSDPDSAKCEKMKYEGNINEDTEDCPASGLSGSFNEGSSSSSDLTKCKLGSQSAICKRSHEPGHSAIEKALTIIGDMMASGLKDDEWDSCGKNWAAKMRKMPPAMQIYSEKLINEVLFMAQTGTLNVTSKVNK